MLGLSLAGCGSRVTITDTEWCADAGPRGAFCVRTLSDRKRHIPAEQWEAERFGQLCTSPATLAEWKAAILKLCEDTGRCDYHTEEAVRNFEARAQRAARDAEWTRF